MAEKMRVYNEAEYYAIPKRRRGRVTHISGRRGEPKWLLGRRTIISGANMLIEGVHFEIDESLV